MAKIESIKALQRYNNRVLKHNYSKGRRVLTIEDIEKIYLNECNYVDWEWAKYFDTSIKPRIDGLTGDTISNTGASFGEKLARHFAYQVELAGNGAFSFRLGFNYNRRQELKLEQRPGMSGFSLGLGLKFKKFKLDYGFVIYSKAGFSNTIGLSAKLGKGKKK